MHQYSQKDKGSVTLFFCFQMGKKCAQHKEKKIEARTNSWKLILPLWGPYVSNTSVPKVALMI